MRDCVFVCGTLQNNYRVTSFSQWIIPARLWKRKMLEKQTGGRRADELERSGEFGEI